MEQIVYQIKTSSKARHVRIAIYPDGKVLVTKPVRVSAALADQFVQRKSAWIKKKLDFVKNKKSLPLLNPGLVAKPEVLAYVKSRIQIYNQHYGVDIGNVAIKNQKSLWGSCSRRRNLNFNIRIAQLPARQADYIIVHELCHLQQFNHSRKFWDLVAQTIPDYKQIRRELKNYSFY